MNKKESPTQADRHVRTHATAIGTAIGEHLHAHRMGEELGVCAFVYALKEKGTIGFLTTRGREEAIETIDLWRKKFAPIGREPPRVPRGPVAQQWSLFDVSVMDPDAGMQQRKMMKLAWAHGGLAVLGAMVANATPDISEEEGASLLGRLTDELRAMVDALRVDPEVCREGRPGEPL